MKKPMLLFSSLLVLGVFFTSCKDEARETEAVIEDQSDATLRESESNRNTAFAQYDANQDDQWDENEFSESYQSEFSGYDADTSGDLNNEEFTGATFRSTDRNRDSVVSRDEWDQGYSNTYGDFTNQEDFDTFDADKSGDLSNDEWNTGFAESDWFGTYDADQNNSVTSQEWSTANFSRWDRNSDGFLDQQEFERYNQAMMGSNTGNSQNNTGNDQSRTNTRNNQNDPASSSQGNQ